MSYRPTISVYINGKIVDNGYYRNWNDKDLFYEAITIAAFFGDCKSRHEYYERMYGTQKVYHVFEPEAFEATEENLKWFEELSEFPVIVDFTNKCIYASYNGPLFSTNLSKRPTVTNGRKIKCKRRIWKQIRPERGDFIEHITNGGFYDSGYGWLEKTVTGNDNIRIGTCSVPRALERGKSTDGCYFGQVSYAGHALLSVAGRLGALRG